MSITTAADAKHNGSFKFSRNYHLNKSIWIQRYKRYKRFIENYSDEVIGFLGDHLRLVISVYKDNAESKLSFFVKCMPRFDKWKAQYLQELKFFKKEYVTLSDIFNRFQNYDGYGKWRPKLLLIKEDLFVFEDVSEMGYRMPCNRQTMSFEEVVATVETLAKFHAQSYVYEEKMSKSLNRPYRIWEDFSEFLQEPAQGQNWRDVGRNAVIALLKQYSKYKDMQDCCNEIDKTITIIYEKATKLMMPSKKYRNVVIHRDLWSNNIFLKRNEAEKIHALLVDFQTVLYCSPLLDVSSFIYFNTARDFRDKYIEEILCIYKQVLSDELILENIDPTMFFDDDSFSEAYNESLVFAVTQAALILPIACMKEEKKKELYCDPKKSKRMSDVSRSEEFVQIAEEDACYRMRVMELLDEIVERYFIDK